MTGLRRRRLLLRLARDELRLRSAAQRGELLQAASALRPRWPTLPMATEGARTAADWLRAHPGLVVTGAAAMAVVLRPRRLLGWAGTLVSVLSLWRRVQPLVAALSKPPRG